MMSSQYIPRSNAAPVKVYVAGAVADVDRVRALIHAIQSAGHKIVCDWTSLPYREPYLDNEEVNRPLAAEMVAAASSCDVLVLADHLALRGALMECGMALASARRVIVSGTVRPSIFFTLPNVELVATDREVVVALERAQRHSD
ncbi:MAG: hypothetical protein QOK16_3956 [Solirubrobacteraceae bacterium]|jgi:hypothetical protein|nr:hypothetical protein [Solirubrobacteraceae bacterium]